MLLGHILAENYPCQPLRLNGQLVEMARVGNSHWFWLCSGSVAMVVLFGMLALVAQFFYWADKVEGLNDQLVEGSKADSSF